MKSYEDLLTEKIEEILDSNSTSLYKKYQLDINNLDDIKKFKYEFLSMYNLDNLSLNEKYSLYKELSKEDSDIKYKEDIKAIKLWIKDDINNTYKDDIKTIKQWINAWSFIAIASFVITMIILIYPQIH